MSTIHSDSELCPKCGLDLIPQVEKATQSQEYGYRTVVTVCCLECDTEVTFNVDWEPTWATQVPA